MRFTRPFPLRRGHFLFVLATALGSATSFAQPFYSFETYAGAKGGAGAVDGNGSAARFDRPAALAVDAQGNVWVADTLNSTIRRVTPNGDVTTVAGKAGAFGFVDGMGAEARFNLPSYIAVDAAENALVTQDHAVRKVSVDGRVTTLAGRTYGGQTDGLGQAALIYLPRGIAVDAQNNAYVLHNTGGIVRKISPAGQVTTVTANSPNIMYGGGLAIGSDGSFYVTDGTTHTIWKIGAEGTTSVFAREYVSLDGVTTRLSVPAGILAMGADFYVADYGNHVIRKIDSAGAITTFAGQVGKFGSADGTRVTARFYGPQGLAADAMGNIYVADRNNYAIRKIAVDGTVTTLAGLPEPTGHADGPVGRAQFRNPRAIALDTAGNVYVADTSNRMIRKITPSGSVTSLGDGAFVAPASVAMDGAGTLYVADVQGHFIGKISPEGVVTRWAGSPAGETVMKGAADGQGLLARFDEPSGVAVNSEGTVYVADFKSHIIRKITAAGYVSTLAGIAYQPGALDGTGVDARFLGPVAIAVDPTGMIYVAEYGNNRIRKITPEGVVSTLSGFAGRALDAPKNPRFYGPAGLAVDGAGNVFVADMRAHRIQRVSPDGFVTTVAGAGMYRDGWDDGIGINARFVRPQGIAVTPDGVVFLADTGNNLIRRGTAVATASAVVSRGAVELGSAAVVSAPFLTAAVYQWEFNGAAITGATGSTLTIDDMTPAKAGPYAVTMGEGAGENLAHPVVVGVASTEKVVGAGEEIGANIQHANGNIYDQVLLTGTAATITADPGQITRVSFLDSSSDIVQVEFAGAGALTLQLEYADGPTRPAKYNQSNVSYIRGRPSIVIVGADETTNVTVFSVGPITAQNQALFKSGEIYDGVADLGLIAIHSKSGKFGGIRTANASYGRFSGWTGIYAPGVTFNGPVYLGGLAATSETRAALVTGSVGEVLISGGEISVTGGWPLLMSGVARLRYGAGITSHNQARAIGGKEGVSFRFLDDVRPEIVIDGGN